jgi:hypothetical protein
MTKKEEMEKRQSWRYCGRLEVKTVRVREKNPRTDVGD